MRRWFQFQRNSAPEAAELDQLLRCGIKRELGPAPNRLSFQRLHARVLDDQVGMQRMIRGGGPGGSNLTGINLLFYVLNSSPRTAWNSVPA